MAHQLNTDYLRRKLLDPQRQVSSHSLLTAQLTLAFHLALFRLLPRRPPSAASFLQLSFLLQCQHCTPESSATLSPCCRTFKILHEEMISPFTFSILYLTLVAFVGDEYFSGRAPRASADHLYPAKPSEPVEKYENIYSPTPYTIPFCLFSFSNTPFSSSMSHQDAAIFPSLHP